MTVWLVLSATVGVALSADLFLHRRGQAMSFGTAVAWTAAWVSLGLSFGAFVLAAQGTTAAGEYYAGYLVEWTLSIDNVFVFAVLFSYFGVPRELQHRALFWGVVGALLFRIVFILVGVELLHRFAWTTYSLGAFVAAAGAWMIAGRREVDLGRHPVLRLAHRVAPVSDGYRGDRFLVRENGVRVATPLLVLLFVIATTDVAFAVDSIPAILAITSSAFVVVASNAFAILGLRSLYFCVVGAMSRFAYLRLGLGAVLLFVGGKLLLADLVGGVPIGASLAVIAGLVATSLAASGLASRITAPVAPSPGSAGVGPGGGERPRRQRVAPTLRATPGRGRSRRPRRAPGAR